MDSGQQKRLESIVRSVLELPAADREAHLEKAYGDEPELLAEVRTFLRARQKTAAFAPDSIDAESSAAATVTDIIGRVVDPFIGEEIDGYRIISRLGAGGMGVVYKVENVSLQRTEALKVISPRLVDNPEVRHKFLGEAHALAKIHHPNIVTVFNLRQSRLGYYITMEYAEGENLAEILGRRRSLPWKEALPLVSQLLSALDYAHGRGIIHRDIKPNNIMITREGAVKVLDFGLAKFFEESAMTTLVSGTLYYMSPEQIDGRDLGPRSDLFSVGMTMYELLSGRLPFNRNASEYSIYRAIKEEPFAHLKETAADLKEEIPDELADIVMCALEKKPDDRFESAATMAEALDRFVESETSPAAQPASGSSGASPGRETGSATRTATRTLDEPAQASGLRKYGPAAALVTLAAIVFLIVFSQSGPGGGPGADGAADPARASLSVNTDPEGAGVLVDGEDVGLTTPLADFTFENRVDSVRLGLRMAGFVPVDTVLHFTGDRRVSLYLPLDVETSDTPDPRARSAAASDRPESPTTESAPAPGGPARSAAATGRLTVDAPPASAVLVNDRAVAPGEPVELSPGSHVVRCGRMPWHAEQIVDVEAGVGSTVRCFFARPIEVTARAEDGSAIAADILIDGERAGSTDGAAQPLRRGPGSYSISVAAEGLRSAEGAVPVTIRPAFAPQDPVTLTFNMVSDAPASVDRSEAIVHAARALRDRLETAIVDDEWADLPEPVVNYYRRWFSEDRRTYDIRNPGVLFETDRMTVDNNQGLLPVTVNYDLVQRGRSQTFSDRVEAVWTISVADGAPRILSVVDGQ